MAKVSRPDVKARAVVLSVGSGGDVVPLAAAAAALARRGVPTTWMAPQRYAGLTPAGVTFRAAGADDVFESVFTRPEVWTVRHGLAESWRYYGAVAQTSYRQLRDEWSPSDTVLVSSSFAVGARLAEDALGFTNTTVHLSPAVIFSYERPPRWPAASIPRHWPPWLQKSTAALAERLAIDPTIKRSLHLALREAGMLPGKQMFSRFLHSPHRVAYLFPDWFAPTAPDWPTSGRHAGFPAAAPFVRETPPQVEHFVANARDPLAIITAGTAVTQRPKWVDRCAAVLLDAGFCVLILESENVAAHPPTNQRVMVAPHSPLSKILHSASLLVHHGGIGTAVEALRAGIPQWLFPTAHDQADNTDRLCQLGVARGFLPKASEQDLGAAAQAVLIGRHNQALSALNRKVLSAPDAITQLVDWVIRDLKARGK